VGGGVGGNWGGDKKKKGEVGKQDQRSESHKRELAFGIGKKIVRHSGERSRSNKKAVRSTQRRRERPKERRIRGQKGGISECQ